MRLGRAARGRHVWVSHDVWIRCHGLSRGVWVSHHRRVRVSRLALGRHRVNRRGGSRLSRDDRICWLGWDLGRDRIRWLDVAVAGRQRVRHAAGCAGVHMRVHCGLGGGDWVDSVGPGWSESPLSAAFRDGGRRCHAPFRSRSHGDGHDGCWVDGLLGRRVLGAGLDSACLEVSQM